MKLYELDEMISSVCPIYGLNTNGDISFKEEATDDQMAAATVIMQANIHLIDGV